MTETASRPSRMRYAMIGLFPAILLAAILIWEVLAPPPWTITTRLGEKIGTAEEAWLAAREEQAAHHDQEMRLAVAQIDRVTAAYQSIYGAYANVAQRALDMEMEVARRQANTIDNTHVVGRFAANAADLGCILSAFDESGELRSACIVADKMRHSMVRDYPQHLNGSRTTLPSELLAKFPHPTDLVINEDMQRLRTRLQKGKEQ